MTQLHYKVLDEETSCSDKIIKWQLLVKAK